MTEEYKSIYEQTAPEQTEPVKPQKVYTRLERIAALSAMVLGFLFVRLVWYRTNGLLTTIFYWLLFTVELLFIHKSGVKLTRTNKLFAAVLYIFSCVYTVTANSTLRGMTTVFLLLTGCLFLFSVGNPGESVFRFLPFTLAKSVFGSPFTNYQKAFGALASQKKGKHFWNNVLYVAGGLCIAFPLTCIVASLLCSSDETFSSMLGNLIRIPPEDILIYVPHIFVGILIGGSIFSCMYRAVNPKESPEYSTEGCEASVLALRMFPNPMVYATVTPICVLYVLYIVSQMQYFIGGFTGVLSDGYTYAEYARQGFFQLCAVCCINISVIFVMEFGAKLTGIVKPLLLRIYSIYLCVCSLFIASTAIAKMLMYIGMYGMTQLRVYTTWFMILLMIGFVVIIIRQLKPLLPIGKIGFTVFVLMFGLLCFSRPDDWMVRYNAEMYLSGQLEEFDTALLRDLSDDAWAALSCYDPDAFGTAVDGDVKYHLQNRTDEVRTNFYEWQNLSSWMMLFNDEKW